MNSITNVIVIIFIFALSQQASATILSGQISSGSEVDQITFTATSTGTFTFDVLAFEPVGIDHFGNGTGNDQLDSEIFLFEDDFAGVLIGNNNNTGSLAPGGSDGSVTTRDSFLSISLNAGTSYALAIGDVSTTILEARNGFNNIGSAIPAEGSYEITILGGSISNVAGPVIIGPTVPVPIPSTLLLLGVGILGLVGQTLKQRCSVA